MELQLIVVATNGPQLRLQGFDSRRLEHAGLSAFALENRLVYHTYSCYSRGLEAFNSAYQLLDRAPRAATRTSCRCRSPGFGATTSTKTGYPRFAAQGGDWGGYVVGRLAHAHCDKLLGAHLNFLPLPLDMPFPAELTEEDRAYEEEIRHWQTEETGYSLIQGTRPQTPAYALTDSPTGLAAWIAEKFYAWSDHDGDLEPPIDIESLLTNITLYRVTGAINSSFWPYYAVRHEP